MFNIEPKDDDMSISNLQNEIYKDEESFRSQFTSFQLKQVRKQYNNIKTG